MINIEKLQIEIRAINIANGWKVPVPEDWKLENRVPTFICLIHSEISELLLGYLNKDKVNFSEELADIVIRIIDLVYGLGKNLDTYMNMEVITKRHISYIPMSWRSDHTSMLLCIVSMHGCCSCALEAFRKQKFGYDFFNQLAATVYTIQKLCENLNIDLQKEIEKKLEKNKTRGIKHGGKKI